MYKRPIEFMNRAQLFDEKSLLDKKLGYGLIRLFSDPHVPHLHPPQTTSAESPHLVILLKFPIDL